jgi:hypothetical protein
LANILTQFLTKRYFTKEKNMNKLSKLAIGLAAAVAFCGQAFAGDTALGMINSPSTFVIGNTGLNGAFTDNYAFSIPSNGWAAGSVTEATINSITDITGLSLSLWTTTGLNSFTAVTNLANGVNWHTGGNSGSSLGVTNLTPGNYEFMVTGIGGGAVGGSYGGSLAISPVPEPGEWALMASGLGLLGFIASRNRRRESMAAA